MLSQQIYTLTCKLQEYLIFKINKLINKKHRNPILKSRCKSKNTTFGQPLSLSAIANYHHLLLNSPKRPLPMAVAVPARTPGMAANASLKAFIDTSLRLLRPARASGPFIRNVRVT